MGINKLSFDSITSVISNIENTNQKTLLELGIQESYYSSDFQYLRDKIGTAFKEYISVDLHPVNGVTVFDLSVFEPNAFSVDILTNIGTSEHVEYEDGQYNCWLNIHNWVKVNGLSIHELPETGSWPNHCRYYCTVEFFMNLQNYGYEVLEIKKHTSGSGNLIWCVLKKVEPVDFMSKEEFFRTMDMDKSVTSDMIDIRNNPKKLNI